MSWWLIIYYLSDQVTWPVAWLRLYSDSRNSLSIFLGSQTNIKFLFRLVAIVHIGSLEILNSSRITSWEAVTKHITEGRNLKDIYDYNATWFW